MPEPISSDELKELIVSFNRMLLRIREQSSRQTAFFASASHELRTPMSVMQTRLQVLMHNEKENTEVKKVFSGQLKEVQQLTKMVNDFLLLSELKSGNMKVITTTVNLADVVTNAISKYKMRTAEKNLHFKISCEPVEEIYDLETDEDKFRIILDNLFDNALKYSTAQTSIDVLIKRNYINISLPLPTKSGMILIRN